MKARLKYIYLAITICFANLVLSQSSAPDIEHWVNLLSVKKDIRAVNARAVTRHLYELDSISRCQMLEQLENEGPKNHVRFQIRLRCLRGIIDGHVYPCGPLEVAQSRLQEALELAYEIDDPLLIVEVHQTMAQMYLGQNDFANSMVHSFSAIEMKKSFGVELFDNAAILLYQLGHNLYHTRDYRSAIRMSHAAIDLAKPHADAHDTLHHYYILQAWNNIGLSHTKLHEYDSAFIALKHAYQLAGAIDPKFIPEFWQGIIKGNIGDVYYQMGKLDSARVLLQQDYETSMKYHQYDNASNSLQWLSRIHLHEGNLPLAIKQLRKADSLEHIMHQPSYRANILAGYIEVFKALKQTDSMDLYLKRYLAVHDSIEQRAFSARAEIINVHMEHQKSIHQIKELNKDKRRILLIRNFIIVVVILFTAIGYLFFHRDRLKMRLRQQLAIRDKEKAEAEVLQANDQLKVFTQHMLEKTELVDALRAQLVQKEYTAESTNDESELIQLSILTDEDWERFRSLFEKVYPGFFQSLKRTTEGITLAEQRMAALIKLKVPAKKAAVILGISPNSVYKTRQRLRHRLGLNTDSELDEFFSKEV